MKIYTVTMNQHDFNKEAVIAYVRTFSTMKAAEEYVKERFEKSKSVYEGMLDELRFVMINKHHAYVYDKCEKTKIFEWEVFETDLQD